MSTQPAITLGAVNLEADDVAGQAVFWSGLLGGSIATSQPDHAFVAAREPGGLAVFLQQRGAARPGHQALHLDLTVPWGSRVEEVARALALGARHEWDVLEEVPWVRWSTLSDPEGNLFCLAEHPPSG